MRLRSIFFFLVLFCSKTAFADFYDNKTGILFRDKGNNECMAVGYYYNPNFIGSINQFMGNVTMPSVVTNNGVTYTVTEIADYAFEYAEYLKSINIPENVLKIGAFAFMSCPELTSIDVSKNVNSIGDGAFAGGGISSINVDKDNPIYMSEDGVLYENSKILQYPSAKKDISFSIPSGINTINTGAFYYCKALSIDIPAFVSSIGEYAFQGCFSKDITVHWNTPISDVPSNIFYQVNISTDTLHVPCGTKELYQAADVWKDFGTIVDDCGGNVSSMNISTSSLSFTGAGEQKTFTITSNTNWTVGSNASWLTVSPSSGSNNGTVTATATGNTTTTQRTATITVNAGVTAQTINVTQEAGTSSLSVSPASLSFAASGGQQTFSITSNTNWTILSTDSSWVKVSPASGSNNGTVTVTIAENTATTQRTATITVNGTGITAQTISVTQAAAAPNTNQTWNLTPTMTAVLDGNGVLTISTTKAEGEAMPDYDWNTPPPWYNVCYNILSVVIKDKVTSIGKTAFTGCLMNSIIIPNTVISIGENAFFSCTLTSANIPASVTFIDATAFTSCGMLISFNVDAGNTVYSSDSGILYNKNKTSLLSYPGGKTGAFTIPNFVSTIGDCAFYGCLNISAVTIPNNVTAIGNSAFRYCSSLTSVSIPGSIKTIADWTFADCTNLISISIPNSVTSIGSMAFDNCSSLTSIAIPNSVTSIGNITSGFTGVFSNCTSLKDVTVSWATPLSVNNIFNGTNTSSATLHVPAGTKALYKADPVWGTFGTIIDDGAPVSTLSISLTSLNFAASGEQNTFNITSNTNWAVSSNASWLMVAPTSGNNNGTVTATVTANTTTTQRTATITVNGTGVTAQTISVTQEATAPTPTLSVSPASLSFAASGEQQTFSITSNTDWTVSGNASWLTISPDSGSNNNMITVTAAANSDTIRRTATVTISGTGVTAQTISITQDATPIIPSLSVSSTSLNFTAFGEQQTFIVTSNTDWIISSSAPWLTVYPTSGSNNATVTVTSAENTATTQRTATITVSGTGVTAQTISITQAAASIIPTLSVSPTSLNFAASGERQAFSIVSNTDWTVSSSDSWVTVSLSSGSNDGTITVTAVANSDTIRRAATVTVSGTGVAAQTISVTQNAADIPSVIPDETQTVGTDGKGSISLNLSIPSSATLTGSFEISFPEGMTLDEELTVLSLELSGNFYLAFSYEGNNTWLIEIKSNALKSSTASDYTNIMTIAYTVNDSVSKGTYEATIKNLDFLQDNGIPIKEDLLTVPINVERVATSIESIGNSSFYAYFINNSLKIESTHAEIITIYSATGVRLYSTKKDVGTIEIPFSSIPGSVYVLKGSKSGTIKVVK